MTRAGKEKEKIRRGLPTFMRLATLFEHLRVRCAPDPNIRVFGALCSLYFPEIVVLKILF